MQDKRLKIAKKELCNLDGVLKMDFLLELTNADGF